MAIVRLPDEERAITEVDEIRDYLAGIGVEYEKWLTDVELPPGVSEDRVLDAYSEEIRRLKERGGYVTVDVIDIDSSTPGLAEMLAKFKTEHWHDEDEVRFTLEGHGIFHIHPREGPVVVIEVSAGDLIRVPRMTYHWFDLCDDRRIRAIRLFQNRTGWTPYYTDSGVDKNYQPVCMGPTYFTPP